LNLRVLNEIKPNVLQYLPYGVTTLEIKIEGDPDELLGYIYPNKLADREKKLFVGFADESEDFLVLWGAGSESGLKVTNENVKGKLYFQILHIGKSADIQSVTLYHSQTKEPICSIILLPAENSTNVSKMDISPRDRNGFKTITFKGNRIPLYYPRWFPPKPSENEKIEYSDIDVPNIKIKFKTEDSKFMSEINSDIDIFLNDDPNPIARIADDWCYSSLHAELFTIFGNADYFVLRVWFYWVNATFSNTLRGDKIIVTRNEGIRVSDNLSPDDTKTKGILDSINIECPDYERFDFLIDMKKKKVTYVGTDFHYQEWWYKIDDGEDFTRAKIAGGIWTIERTLMGLKERFDTKENFDPMTLLKVMLKQESAALSPMKILREYIQSNRSRMGPQKAVGFFGKHIPYPENGRAIAELVSSIATS
jgi:hypothetical protein